MVSCRYRWAREKAGPWLPAVVRMDGFVTLFCESGTTIVLSAPAVEWGGWFDADGRPSLLDDHERNHLRSQVHTKDQRIRQLEEYVDALSARAQGLEASLKRERDAHARVTSELEDLCRAAQLERDRANDWATELRAKLTPIDSLNSVRRAVLLREPGGGADLEVAADLCSTSTKARAAVHLVLYALDDLNRSIAMDKAGA